MRVLRNTPKDRRHRREHLAVEAERVAGAEQRADPLLILHSPRGAALERLQLLQQTLQAGRRGRRLQRGGGLRRRCGSGPCRLGPRSALRRRALRGASLLNPDARCSRRNRAFLDICALLDLRLDQGYLLSFQAYHYRVS